MQYSFFEVNPFRWEGGKRLVYRRICNLETDACYVSGGDPKWTEGMLADWRMRDDGRYVYIQSNNVGGKAGPMRFYLIETATGRELPCANCWRLSEHELSNNRSIRWEGSFLRFNIAKESLRTTAYWMATIDNFGYYAELITELPELESPAHRTGTVLSQDGRYLGWAECAAECERVIFDREENSTSRFATPCKIIHNGSWREGDFSTNCGS